MNSEEYAAKMWQYMAEHYPETRIAWKGHGRTPWKYSTVADYKSSRQDPGNFNHRAILPCELVADYDCPGEQLEGNVMLLIERMSKAGYNFSVWRTNGDKGGVHIHSLWDIPENVSNSKLLKTLLLEHLVGHIDEMGVDRQLTGTHLVRFENGNYEKLPAGQAGRKTVVYDNGDPFIKNSIPQEVWSEYAGHVLSERLRLLRKSSLVPTQKFTPPSIRFLLSDQFKSYRDGGKRALFVLASYYRKLPDDQLWKLLHDFNRYNVRTPLDDKTIGATIKSVREHKGAHVGEPYRKDLLRSIGAYKEVYGDE